MTALCAILLGAGRSTRFGAGNKLLSEVDGIALAAHVAGVVAKALPTAQRVLVIGPDGDGVRQVCSRFVTDVAVNPDPERGLASSIATGLSALSAESEQTAGVLITQMDMPGLSAELVTRLCDAFAADGGGRIVFPADPEGRQRTPVIWPVASWDALARLSGDTGGKALIEAAERRDEVVRVVLTPAEADAVYDIDTQAQLTAWRERQPQ